MTAIKAKYEGRLVLDFSKGKYSKNKIKQSLRKCEIISSKPGIKPNEVTIFDNTIKIGMYTIHITLPYDSPATWNNFKQFKDFVIFIEDNKRIDLSEDGRFKYQYWIKNNIFGWLKIKHLVDIIAHCIRLNNLKAFL
jgi:hypothetical protein